MFKKTTNLTRLACFLTGKFYPADHVRDFAPDIQRPLLVRCDPTKAAHALIPPGWYKD